MAARKMLVTKYRTDIDLDRDAIHGFERDEVKGPVQIDENYESSLCIASPSGKVKAVQIGSTVHCQEAGVIFRDETGEPTIMVRIAIRANGDIVLQGGDDIYIVEPMKAPAPGRVE